MRLLKSFAALYFCVMCACLPVWAGSSLSLSAADGFPPDGWETFTVSGAWNVALQVWRLSESGQRQSSVFQGKFKHDRESGEFARDVRLGAGLYLAEASSGYLRSSITVRLTDIGVITKRAPRELLVYAVRLSNNLPARGTLIKVTDPGVRGDKGRWLRRPQPARSARTGADGVARFTNLPTDGALRITATNGRSLTQLEAPLSEERAEQLKVLFYPDRPIYRPGQTMHFKGIVRQDLSVSGLRQPGTNGTLLYGNVPDRDVQIELTDAANNKLDTLHLKTNGMGSFAGSFDLPEEGALGLYSVSMNIVPPGRREAEPHFGRFNVQAYRKPEYEVAAVPLLDPARPWAVQGQPFRIKVAARYFFGGAVKGGKVVYSGAAQGETKLDENGEATINVQNPRPENPQVNNEGYYAVSGYARPPAASRLSVHFQVTDDSNRIAETDASVLTPWSEVSPAVATEHYIYQLQDTARFDITTSDPLGRPVSSKARLRLFYFRPRKIVHTDSLREETVIDEVEFWNGMVQTDTRGQAAASARLGRAGYIKAVVSTMDSGGRSAFYTYEFWVSSGKEHNYWGYDFQPLHLMVDKNSYQAGEKVHALIGTSNPGATALVTLQSDRIWWYRVVKLTGRATVLDFPFPAAAMPGAHLMVGYPRGTEWVSDNVYLKALDPARQLSIQMQPSKPEYRPGETANYQISVRDGLGHPARTELSLAFIDKAIYAITSDPTPDPVDFFYGARPDRVATAWTFPREYEGGSYQRIEAPVKVRRRFEDTAYWNPFVTTDNNGNASLQFEMPDNLTTWRATARGVTTDTAVGQAMHEILVTKPLLVRLLLPRFFVQDDKTEALVIVQNNTKSQQSLRVSLRGDGAQLEPQGRSTNGAQTGTVEAGQSKTFRWMVQAGEVPPGGKATFTATARGDSNAGISFADSTDAMQLKTPLLAHGVRADNSATGIIPTDGREAAAQLTQPEQALRNASKLEVRFSPSLAGPMLSALPDLIGYPYGCTEQTLSRFVPTITAARALRKLGKPLPPSMKELPKQVHAGLTTLAGYQHRDGGWGWWANDDTDPFLTGYVVYSLGLTVEAGYSVDRAMLLRGLRSIQAQFHADERVRSHGEPQGYETAKLITPDTRAWMAMGYYTAIAAAKVQPKELEDNGDFIGAVYKVRDKLSSYALASLAVAEARALETGALKAARTAELPAIIALLENRAVSETTPKGPATYWTSGVHDYGWRDSNIETTALAVQALLRAKPDSPLIVPALRWLLLKRQGNLWESTKDSAQAVIALADYLQRSRELEPDETVRVRVNGELKQTVHFTADDLYKPDQLLTIAGINDDAHVTFEREGKGAVYFSAKLSGFTSKGLDAAEDNGFSIERRYATLGADGHWHRVNGPISNGELVRVELRITSKRYGEYISIEDPLPAGFEVRPGDDAKAWPQQEYFDQAEQEYDPPRNYSRLWVTNRENRDDRVAFFSSYLYGSKDHPGHLLIRYIIRPETTGTRAALPARMQLMYHPDINGRSAQDLLRVQASAADTE